MRGVGLAIGVNRAPGVPPLACAENDAIAIWRAQVGGVGLSSPDDVRCLLGSDATRPAILRWLRLAAMQSLDYLTFFFSGHGSPDGIMLADGILPYKDLATALARVDAPRALFITDTCHAGAFDRFRRHAGLSGIDGSAPQLLLLRAVRGTRLMFSVGEGRLAGEDRTLGHGFFTYSLVRSLLRSDGDLELGGVSCVSDARAFAGAALIARAKFGQVPLSSGLTGDLPLAVSEAHMVIGSASILLADDPRGLSVRTVVSNRMFVPTVVRASLVDARDRVVFSAAKGYLPNTERAGVRTLFPFPAEAVLGDPWCRAHLQRYGGIVLRWDVTIEDGHGHRLEEVSHLTGLTQGRDMGELLLVA